MHHSVIKGRGRPHTGQVAITVPLRDEVSGSRPSLVAPACDLGADLGRKGGHVLAAPDAPERPLGFEHAGVPKVGHTYGNRLPAGPLVPNALLRATRGGLTHRGPCPGRR